MKYRIVEVEFADGSTKYTIDSQESTNALWKSDYNRTFQNQTKAEEWINDKIAQKQSVTVTTTTVLPGEYEV